MRLSAVDFCQVKCGVFRASDAAVRVAFFAWHVSDDRIFHKKKACRLDSAQQAFLQRRCGVSAGLANGQTPDAKYLITFIYVKQSETVRDTNIQPGAPESC